MYAYVLISLDEPEERQVLDTISSFDEVQEAHLLFGEWDIIVKLKLDNSEEVTNFLIEKLRTIDSIRLTSTLIVAE